MKVLDVLTQVGQQIAFAELELARQDEVAGRDAHFSALVERHSRFVFRIAYALLRNTHDSEDVVQEIFLKLYRRGDWERLEDERSFLSRAAWRLALTRLRKRVPAEPGPELASTDLNPEDHAIAADWSEAIQRLIDSLPEDLRRPLALSTVEELNSREIAGVMGVAEGTVRTRLMRARQLLREKVIGLKVTHEKR